LTEKLEEFATTMTVLKKFLKKRTNWGSKFMKNYLNHALAVQEWLDGKIYHRDSNK
jgi:hypothetical protein